MESKACDANNDDLLSSSAITSNGGSSSPFFLSSIRGTIIENTSSTGTLTQIPFFPKYEVDLEPHRQIISHPGKEYIERVLEEYSHQVKDLQKRLNESNELHEKQKFYLRQSVIDLQTKLQEMQMERDAMADIRRRENQSEEDLRNQLQNTVHELEAAKCLKEDMLKDSNIQMEQLRKMMLSHEGVLQEIRSILVDFEEASGKKIYEHETMSTIHVRNLGSAISKILRELDTEISYLKGRIFPVEDQLEALKSESQNKIELLLQQHQDRIEQLMNEHEIEITGLTEKASSARSQASSIQSQMEIIQEQARNQNSMYMRQLSDLESTVSQLRSELREAKRKYEDKIEELEKQLVLANSELTEARTERDQFSQESGNLDDQLQTLLILKDKKDAKIRELEARVSDLELEKVKLVNAGSERLRAVKDIKQERDQLLNEVKTSRNELNSLSEDYEVLKRNFRNKSEEMETTTNKLKMQLKSAQTELEQTRNTLKSMEGSDGHAMKVAMGMQKQITAKRGQIDALQSKIQFLEEAMTTANKEKHFLKEEKNKLSQELNTVATEKNKMAGELEVLRSQERRLKEKVANMEVALDKASLQFAECQDIIQRQEQESMRLKLQHTLDVKELQGPGYTSNTSVKSRLIQSSNNVCSHSNVPSSQSTTSFLSHHSMKPNTLKEDPTRDLKQLLQELRSVINEEPSVSLSKTEDDGRTASLGALDDRVRDCVTDSSLRSEICHRSNSVRDSIEGSKSSETLSREPATLHTGDLEEPSSCFIFPSTASPSVKNTASRSFHSSTKKSPVHSLLTSSIEDSIGSASPYRSTKPVHSSDSVKVSVNRNNRKNMQEASEQTGKLTKSGRRFTAEEPSNVFNDQKPRKEDTESKRPGKNVTKMKHCLPILYRELMTN
ncbi:coiled-coil domain-containing protein 158 isoform X7 [Choloepus didactylus]|uniref:coiled-coil domain-containing protein 158 isoform X7 n=1 Tax=Choloepus didactylus TaxID=27675 RepID=UPI00189FB302|nr:coiled-coil domain-containing protein 158 isoform X7 [Choloepus didactylus]